MGASELGPWGVWSRAGATTAAPRESRWPITTRGNEKNVAQVTDCADETPARRDKPKGLVQAASQRPDQSRNEPPGTRTSPGAWRMTVDSCRLVARSRAPRRRGCHARARRAPIPPSTLDLRPGLLCLSGWRSAVYPWASLGSSSPSPRSRSHVSTRVPIVIVIPSARQRSSARSMLGRCPLISDRNASSGSPTSVVAALIASGRGAALAPHAALARYQPSQRYYLLDDGRVGGADLPSGHLVSALIALETNRDRLRAPELLEALIHLLRKQDDKELTAAFTEWAAQVLLSRRFRGSVSGSLPRLEEARTMLAETVQGCTAEWVEEGRDQGCENGIQGQCASLCHQVAQDVPSRCGEALGHWRAHWR